MRTLGLLLLLPLAACATPESIYRSEVDFDEVSAKPMSEVSQCLQLRWATSPITTPDNKVAIPIRNGFGQVLGMITLEAVDTGTRVQVRKTGQLVIGTHDYRKCM